jgi:hypothetical protein
LEDPASLDLASRSIYGIYSVQDFWSIGAKRKVEQGKNLADAAKKAGVKHFVYSSVGCGTQYRRWPLGEQMGNREIHPQARTSRDGVTAGGEIGILQGKLYDPVRADKPYQTIASDDIGGFVALAFERPKEFMGVELKIAGPS